jgi:coenzyme F420 biosynthesis associated uncharacterized protein
MSPDPSAPRDDAASAVDAPPASTAVPMIDWRLAESTALKLMPSRPTTHADEAYEVVAGLRRAAVEAEQPIADVTQMEPVVPLAPVRVVDRATWARLNIADMAAVLEPLVAVLREKRRREGRSGDDGAADDASPSGHAVVTAIGSRATGFQVGSLMAFVGTKVLGQHELFTPADRAAQLLLVAPNVLLAERNLGVDPASFRRWVCLHEQTHRVQLAAVPWLREHIERDLHRFFTAADTDTPLGERLSGMVGSVGSAIRGSGGSSMIEAVQTPEQRDILDRLVALMTLLEGHADWAMDAVGEDVVPGLADVRSRFEKRRAGGGTFDQVLRRLFGLDAKLAQYRDGAAFVRNVVDLVGVEGLNAAWSSAEALPMREEIADARRWADRVLTGSSA